MEAFNKSVETVEREKKEARAQHTRGGKNG